MLTPTDYTLWSASVLSLAFIVFVIFDGLWNRFLWLKSSWKCVREWWTDSARKAAARETERLRKAEVRAKLLADARHHFQHSNDYGIPKSESCAHCQRVESRRRSA